jgi:hypothetical protein
MEEISVYAVYKVDRKHGQDIGKSPDWLMVSENVGMTSYVKERMATRVIVSNGVTGHCECGDCKGGIDPWDSYCRHCGAKLYKDRQKNS